MPASLMPMPKQAFYGLVNGVMSPIVGGKVYTYKAGTTTPKDTYTTAAGNVANPNPVVLDARGEASVWMGFGAYDIVLKGADDALIWTQDGVLRGSDSSTIDFLQAGTDAVGRTAQAKMRESVSVKDFGAVGDGEADDTAAIRAAITALVDGQTLYIPKGTYRTTATITINKKINIVGESKFYSIIMAVGFASDTTILNFTGTTDARLQDMRMENFSLWSNNNLARGMTLTWVNKSKFTDLYFYNLYRGVVGDNAWSNGWRNISSQSITTELFQYGAECNNNHFDRVEFRGDTGIKVIGNTAGLRFTACDFEGITSTTGYGCLLAPIAGTTISGIVFDGCYFENIKGTAISCDGIDANSVRGLVINGNYFFGGRTRIFGTAGNAVNALILRNITGFRVTENMFLDWESNAIFRDGTELNGSVENNTLSIVPALTNASNRMAPSVSIRNNTFGRKEYYDAAHPTTGAFTAGDFVWNTAPSKDANSMLVLGWSRATTGSAHVLGTDWIRSYVSHLSPAI